jgi:Spy/CpxP family protein refolding chaperone
MTIMRKLIVPAALAVAAALPLAAFAAPQAAATAPAAAHWKGHQHRGFFAALHLSASQKTQIKQLMRQFRQNHPKGSPRDPAARKQLRAQIMNVLTPQQRTQLAQMRKMRKERRERNGQ